MTRKLELEIVKKFRRLAAAHQLAWLDMFIEISNVAEGTAMQALINVGTINIDGGATCLCASIVVAGFLILNRRRSRPRQIVSQSLPPGDVPKLPPPDGGGSSQ